MVADPQRVLVANRGEIAVRIGRAARALNMTPVAVFSEDDADAPYLRSFGERVQLAGAGVPPYLDVEGMVQVAVDNQCGMLHPGYGFLSENPKLPSTCATAGVIFVGASAEVLQLFGDKAKCRAFAEQCEVPVLPGTTTVDLPGAQEFMRATGGAVMVKALAGGGGRGMRPAHNAEELTQVWEQCQSEAKGAFGDDSLYVEQLAQGARHLEVQLLADRDQAMHLWERDCSLQRRRQKLVELAPALGLPQSLLQQLRDDALKLARKAHMQGLATAEFLVWQGAGGDWQRAFIEVNPRLQVEHTVSEQITGVDLVATQLQLAQGKTLEQLGLDSDRPPLPTGCAVQLRINAERILADGTPAPSGGRVEIFEPPLGAGVRVDAAVASGYAPNPRFDSLLAKLVVTREDPDCPSLMRQVRELLAEFRLTGIDSNLGFLINLLAQQEVATGAWHTELVRDLMPKLVAGAADSAAAEGAIKAEGSIRAEGSTAAEGSTQGAGATLGEGDVPSPMAGQVLKLEVAKGGKVSAGQSLLVLEAMKMEHLIEAPADGTLAKWHVQEGDAVQEGAPLYRLKAAKAGQKNTAKKHKTNRANKSEEAAADPDHIRADLRESLDRHAAGQDASRAEAVAKRRARGQRTARENLAELCDPGSFIEYGALAIAAQRRRRSEEDLIANTPADGLVAGLASVNGDLFAPEQARCAVLSYDYMVLAGTQGQQNHRKKDRLFELARDWRLPVVLFSEGGGGRPGDTDGIGVAGLDCLAFEYFASLSGRVPLVGVNSGRCFAGNAALLGCCDVVIATEDSNIGMGGPAMIEGGGLGVFKPEEIGPIEVQRHNGVVDIVAADEAEATQLARQYLSYFQGSTRDFSCPDQRLLRSVVPENRRRVYEVRRALQGVADTDSVLELRADFAPGMITALARIEGRPIGVIANNPMHQAGAIESDGADKASRFMQLCDAFDLPLLLLCDTPGIMVGPEAEKTALVRHAARMFVTGASLSVPCFTVVLRKAYGLGAQAMAGGGFKANVFTVSWPTGEFGGMGLEGAVKLGYRRELDAVDDPDEREKLYEEMVERMYRRGKALNTASHFEIDAVIDPAETRSWLARGLKATAGSGGNGDKGAGRRRPFVDSW